MSDNNNNTEKTGERPILFSRIDEEIKQLKDDDPKKLRLQEHVNSGKRIVKSVNKVIRYG